MDPGAALKLMGELKRFQRDHPKVTVFGQKVLAEGIPEGSVIEMSITRPGEETITANLKVLPEDVKMMELLRELKD